MKFRFGLTFILLVELASVRGYLLEESELTPASEYSENVKRDKRTLTTICVEIKPSSPDDKPYFMCRGTDAPQPSKSSSYGGSGPQPSKPSYKPNPSSSYGESESYQPGYHSPVKTNYQQDHTKYGAPISYEPQLRPGYGKPPSFTDPASSGSYSSYGNAKPSYGVKEYDSHDYSKPNGHLSIHGASSKPQDYKPSTYSGSDSAGYSKPSSYGPSSAYTSQPVHGGSSYSGQSGAYTSQPVHGGSSYYGQSGAYISQPAHGGSSYSGQSSPYISQPAHRGGSYSIAPQGVSNPAQSSSYDGKYPGPSSYSSKPTSYEQTDHLGYSLPKSPYSSPSPPKAYSKPILNPSSSYTKPEYHEDLIKHSTPDYSLPSPKPVFSSNPQAYRGMTEDLMAPMWDSQQQGDYFHFRPVEYYMNTQRSMEPLLYQPDSFDQSGPQLQMASPLSANAGYDAYSQPLHYAPTISSYQPSAVLTPSPTYTPYIPVPYSPAPISYAPQIQAYQPPIHLLKPSCPQSYLYSLQPTLISLPCLSSDPAGSNLGVSQSVPQQFYQANINPLHDVPGGRSAVGETDKSTENNSSSVQSEQGNKKLDAEKESTPKKPEADGTNEKPTDKKADQTAAKEKPKEDQITPGAASNQPEDNNTKVAYEALIKMSKLAAQLKKDPDEE